MSVSYGIPMSLKMKKLLIAYAKISNTEVSEIVSLYFKKYLGLHSEEVELAIRKYYGDFFERMQKKESDLTAKKMDLLKKLEKMSIENRAELHKELKEVSSELNKTIELLATENKNYNNFQKAKQSWEKLAQG